MWVNLAHWMCAGSHIRTEPRRRLQLVSVVTCVTLLLVLTCSRRVARGEGAAKSLCSCAVCRCSIAQTRQQCAAESGNFVVQSFLTGPSAVDVARHCELVCSQLRHEVFGLGTANRWQPKCRVVLHANRQDYANAVGRGASQTVGSSAISLSGGRVTQRRIDLLAVNVEQGLSALPHELVHVLFADAFPKNPPPKWAEEGLALLMDPADKRARHAHDLEVALRARSTLQLARLLSDVDYPVASQRAAFYAQSMSLVEYLTQLDTPKEFVRYLKLLGGVGHDRALEAVYKIDRQELEQRWWQRAAGTQLVSADSLSR